MDTPTTGYRNAARLFHWSVAILVLLMIPAGFLMVQEGLDRATQNMLFIFHKNVGVLVLILVVARITYRLVRPPEAFPSVMPAMQERAAHLTHLALYALLLVMPIAGYVRVRAGGFPIESLNAMGIPAMVPRSDELAEFAKLIHYLGSYAIAAFVGLHIAAAAYHGLVRRDGIFTRMWPPIKNRST
ncbi:unnamed protein product [Ectocarpus sp. 12 AP-2014]